MADCLVKDQDLRNRAQTKIAETLTAPLLPKINEQDDHKGLEKTKEKSLSFSNIIWLVCSILVFYLTDFASTCLYNPEVDRFYFNIAIFLFGVMISIAIFLIVWVTYIQKRTSDQWEKLHPYAIPTATACATIGSLWFVHKSLK
ncbi:DgyrCDS8501 [Dimorphilus gyrociliatus]|uniref:DgyrCDS8501 n=1 Tax=Dimorphilus gyrociliatus TaxID=2664684 RepID=A0A7I8VUD7_9ANNE|nr:DgyrCDS8501 [Dimorphilus gyrociliatus]